MILRRTLLRSALAALATLALALPTQAGQIKAPEELGRLHVLMCADTNSNLAPMIKIGMASTRAAFTAGVPADRLDFVVVQGDEMSPENILKKIQSLPVRPNDAVCFFYFGHGAIDQKTGEHVFTLTKVGVDGFKPLLRKQVLEALAAKKAGLTVVLTDCCSSVAPVLAGPLEANVQPARELSPVMRCLFFQHRGLVDITAADKGTFAWFDGKVGGMFTHALSHRLLRKPLAELDTNKDGFLTWAEFAEQLRDETNRVFVERKQTWSNRDEIDQASQYAWIFTVPEPGGQPTAIRPAVRPVQGYRLGVRVMTAPRGVKIVAVVDGSPAAKLGLEKDDVILSVNGMPVRNIEEYARFLDASPMGKARLVILDARTMKEIVKDAHLDPIR
jgi:hypothetical protein